MFLSHWACDDPLRQHQEASTRPSAPLGHSCQCGASGLRSNHSVCLPPPSAASWRLRATPRYPFWKNILHFCHSFFNPSSKVSSPRATTLVGLLPLAPTPHPVTAGPRQSPFWFCLRLRHMACGILVSLQETEPRPSGVLKAVSPNHSTAQEIPGNPG